MQFCRLLVFIFVLPYTIASVCPPTGPVLPIPNIPQHFPLNKLTDTLNDLVHNSHENGWNSSTNSFSVMATSRNSTFFSHHYTAPLKNESGVSQVGDDTVYMIASVTKVFTVLSVWLEDSMALDDPIGKYVEELNAPEWEHLTLRLLTSQLAALPRDGFAFDRGLMWEELVPLGFPPLQPSDIPPCGTGPGAKMCSRKAFFESLSHFEFTGQVARQAAYSDIAYILLGYALETVTGKSFEDVVQSAVIRPLGLDRTTSIPPEAEEAILPIGGGNTFFGFDFAYFTQTAGMYSTANDLSKFLRHILNNTLLSQSKTNEWLKPSAFTSQIDQSVGAPWEIFRPTGLTKMPRAVEHYTKSGDLPAFSSSYISLVPEFGLGVTILGAGPDASELVSLLLDAAHAVLVPAFEDLARAQAAAMYAGDYELTGENSSTISLEVDDGPGLKVSKWMNRGADMLKSFDVLKFGATPEDAVPADVRFYPLATDNRWRVGFAKPASEQEPKKSSSLRGGACIAWMQVDNFQYGMVPIDEVHFDIADDGAVEQLVVPGLRATLRKV